MKIKVKCSSGTHIRSLGYDIGEALGVGAYLSTLERISIGEFLLKDACELDEIDEGNWGGFLI